MGGIGSTRWLGYRKKCTVEASLSLDISHLVRTLRRRGMCSNAGTVAWVHPRTNAPLGSCAYELETTHSEYAWLCLRYHCQSAGGEPAPVKVQVMLTTTHQFFGGLRWWGICLLDCGRRI